MKRMNIKAAIWDLDGTLLNTLDDLAASTNAALAAKTTGGRVGKRLMEACYIADLLLGWQDEGRARPAWTYRLFARVFGEQAKK